MKSIRNAILTCVSPLTRILGVIKIPRKKHTTTADVLAVLTYAQTGDVLVSHNNWELSNVFIPGYWKHAAVVIEIGAIKFVVEAVSPLVRLVPLDWWVSHHDCCRILRPQFLTPEQCSAYPTLILRLVGRSYDYMFEPGNNAFYCAEIITWSIMQVYGGNCPWTHRETLGVDTTLPQDFANSNKFTAIGPIYGR